MLIVAGFLPLSPPLLAAEKGEGYRLLELEGYLVKWGEHRLGAGAKISYAFADETLHFDDARNCGVLAPMKALSGQDLPFETLVQETAAAFRVWEGAADLSFHRVADARDADIILGAQGQPRRRAFANVTFASHGKGKVRAIDQALICLNPEQKWKVGFGGDTEIYDIRYTLIHEIGHAIGLDHPGPSGQVMGFRYTENFPGLQPGDLRGIQQLYGHRASDSQLVTGTDPRHTESAL
ncbi:matrixin family metalloprotease [Marinobacter sp. ATCH36]|uniref:matrixin family metalloprotease n=1 Tax=Marinobacter sp. ATCH36 TaxID=2945106 RepID=UPI0020213F3B|nr:matrixin family metalloprotease [Marinobacter sp. ATCH36]MCL7945408.1 matrixin family metalloprotease [Marinobacter sp. ATCH36]